MFTVDENWKHYLTVSVVQCVVAKYVRKYKLHTSRRNNIIFNTTAINLLFVSKFTQKYTYNLIQLCFGSPVLNHKSKHKTYKNKNVFYSPSSNCSKLSYLATADIGTIFTKGL